MRFWRILTLLLVVAVAGINIWRTGLDGFPWGSPPATNPPITLVTAGPALFAVGFAWLTGALLTGLLWPRRGETALVLTVGAGLGLGLASLIFHFASLVTTQPLALAFPAELVLCCGLLFLWLRKVRTMPPPPAASKPAQSWLGSLVRAVFVTACGVALYSLTVTWRAMPAELCSRVQLSDLPLVPAGMARSWAYTGGTSPLAAGLGAAVFSAATLGLLVAGVARLRNRLIALTGGVVLLGTPLFSRFTPVEHADIPFGFFLLAATTLLSLARDEGDHGVLFLAGLAAGLAAWTKSEGLLLCAGVGLVCGAIQFRAGRWRHLPPLLGGLALALVPLACLKLAGPRENAVTLAQFADGSRHLALLRAGWRDLPRFGEWYTLPFLVMALHLTGTGRSWLERRNLAGAALLLLLLAGFYAGGLLGPGNLMEYLDGPLARLLMQAWPAAIFLWCLLAVRAALPAGQTSPAESPADSPPSGRSA